MKNVKQAHLNLVLKPIKVVRVNRRKSVVLELPDGKRISLCEGDDFAVTASFNFTEGNDGTYTFD